MKGAVAGGHPVTVAAACDVLQAGGNAFDAAIAAVFASCVAEPVLSSLGGGGFLLARGPGQPERVFDFFAQTPIYTDRKSDQDFYPVVVDFGHAQQEFHIGLGACATPGCVSGLFSVHKELASMSMCELAQPAVAAARDGLKLTDLQGFIIILVAPIYTTPGSGGIFNSSESNNIAKAGETLRLPEFADVMEILAIEGPDLFYRGEIANSIVDMCTSSGGHLHREDLALYKTEMRLPLTVDYRDARILTNPPPSNGGILVAFGLRLLSELAMGGFAHNSYEHLRRLIDVMRVSTLARTEHMTGPGPNRLLDKHLHEQYRAQVYGHPQFTRGTTHISVADEKGNVAAVTISNGEGCGHVVPGTGIMLNNMLGEEDLNPDGFGVWSGNQRMGSMMAPTIVLAPDDQVFVTGSGGSNRIRTALLQVLSNLIDFDFDLTDAVSNPRIHIEDKVLNIEGGIEEQVVAQLISEFPEHRCFKDLNLFFGGAHSVSRQGHRFSGCGDPRRGGVYQVLLRTA